MPNTAPRTLTPAAGHRRSGPGRLPIATSRPCGQQARTAVSGLLVAVLSAVVLMLGASPAQAITNGVPDGNAHPYVGLVTNGGSVCSGSAVGSKVLVTAAHCFDRAGERVFVTFDPAGFDSVPVTGRWYPDPNFCAGCTQGLPGVVDHDVAVVVLDAPVRLARYAQLPRPGLVDTLPQKQALTVVGYGVQNFQVGNGPPRPGDLFTRYSAAVDLTASSDILSSRFVKVTANPAQGKGGICFGDSGGPTLRGDTVLAINSFVSNNLCRGVTYSYRIDTPEAIAFIKSFQ